MEGNLDHIQTFGDLIFRSKAAFQGTLEGSIKEFHERYGPVVRYSPRELSFSSSAAWKDIYGFHEHALPKDPVTYGLVQISRDGSHSIFTADGEQHPRVRKLLSYAFSERALRDQEPFVKQYVDLLIQRLHERAASPDPKVDLVEWYNFTTFDIVGDLAIAQSFGCLRYGKYHEWVHAFWKMIKLGTFVRTMALLTHSAFPQLLRALAPRALKEARRRNMGFVGSKTEQRLSEGIRGERRDFISYVLKSNLEQAQKKNGITLSNSEIEANINFLLMAGTETTATALSGTTYYLLTNHEALRRATEEVRNAFKCEEDLTFVTAAERLPYVQACLEEGLRLYPPGPVGGPRRTPKGTKTVIAGHVVPGDVTVGVHGWAASHSPENFHQASKFIPERWLLPPEDSSSSSPFGADRHAASQPFSLGPRSCLGKPFAWNEMRVMLARVLWSFDLELSPESDGWEKQKVYTLWDKGPLIVKLRASQPKWAEK
ncbi:MAG: hypothetical protein Q9191_003760 [Dirinaria sp. TL-2023a]